MGVAGSGKSLIGAALATRLGFEFVEGDAYHPPANIAKMAAGIPLEDVDRRDWLDSLAGVLHEARRADRGVVLSCSALKRSYRDALRHGDPDVCFVFLRGPRALLAERLASRTGHFMPTSLLDSQLDTLEEPADDEKAVVCDIGDAPRPIVDRLILLLSCA